MDFKGIHLLLYHYFVNQFKLVCLCNTRPHVLLIGRNICYTDVFWAKDETGIQNGLSVHIILYVMYNSRCIKKKHCNFQIFRHVKVMWNIFFGWSNFLILLQHNHSNGKYAFIWQTCLTFYVNAKMTYKNFRQCKYIFGTPAPVYGLSWVMCSRYRFWHFISKIYMMVWRI